MTFGPYLKKFKHIYNESKRPAYRYRESLTYYAEEFACGGWLVSQIYSGVYRLYVEPENQR